MMLRGYWETLKTSGAQRLLAGAAALLAIVLLMVMPSPSESRGIMAAGLSLAARANAALAAWLLLPRFVASRRNAAWRLMAVGLGLWMLADLLHLLGWIAVAGGPPMPYPSEWLRLAGSAAYVSSLFLYPVRGQGGFGRIRNLLEVTLITCGVLALIWLMVIRPVLQVGIPNTVAAVWAIAVLTMDFAAAALTFRLATLGEPGVERPLFLGLAASLLLVIAGDFMEALQILNRGQRTAGLVEAGWTLGSGIAALAFVQARRAPSFIEGAGRWRRRLDPVARMARWLPLVLTYLVVGFIIVDWRMTGEFDLVGVLAAGILSLLLVARQGVLAGQSEMRQHAALVNAAADLAFVCQLDGTMVLTNPALRSVAGWGEAEPEDLRVQDLIVGDGVAAILEEGAGSGWSGEVAFQTQSGGVVPVALSLRPLADERREEPLLAATGHDLTEVKAREDELRSALTEVAQARRQLEELNLSLESKVSDRTQELADTVERLERLNEELKELDRLKSEFVALVSHELRGPLTNIRSGVELALKRAERIPVSVEETLRLVSTETERLAGFVKIILDLSALEAGRFPLTEAPIPLGQVARAVVSRFSPGAGKQRIEIDISDELSPVKGDESSIMSVLFHLIDNALKYAPQGPVVVSAGEQDGSIQVLVDDEGPGIPPAEREAVFDRFHRLDASDSREVYGHGLGLYLSRRLVEAMGGRIEALAAPGGGARIAMWLPIHRDAPD